MKLLARTLLLAAGLCGAACAAPSSGEYGNNSAVRLEAQSLDMYGQGRKRQLAATYQTLMPRAARCHGTLNFSLTLVNQKSVRREIMVGVAAEASSLQTVVLEPAGSATLTFNLPATDATYYGRGSEIRLREGNETWEAASIGPEVKSNDGERLINVLAGPGLDAIATAADYAKEDEKATASDSSQRYRREYFCFHTQAMGDAGWSDDVRAYTGHDIVLLTDAEWARLATGVRRALAGFVAEGGTLLLCGGKELPAEAAGFLPVPAAAPAGAATAFAVGGGCVVLAPPLDDTRRPPLARAELVKLGQKSSWALRAALCADRHLDGLLKEMPALDLPTMPVSFFMLILALFALGVVPGALIFCIRRGQRIQALVLLPLVSFAIGVAIVIVILAFYGTTPRVSARAFVLLNAADRRAVVSGRACVFSPRDVVGRLRFSPTAEIVVFGRAGQYRYGADTGLGLCLDGGAERKASGSGWQTPLKPAFYATLDVRDTNARLVVEELGADVVKVTNLLGGPLTDLQVVDSRGRLFAAQGIADGATCELRPAPATAKPFTAAFRPERRDCRRVFKAEIAGSPFLTDTLGGSKAKRTAQTTVVGGYGKGVSE